MPDSLDRKISDGSLFFTASITFEMSLRAGSKPPGAFGNAFDGSDVDGPPPEDGRRLDSLAGADCGGRLAGLEATIGGDAGRRGSVVIGSTSIRFGGSMAVDTPTASGAAVTWPMPPNGLGPEDWTGLSWSS